MKIVDKTFGTGEEVALCETLLIFNQEADCLTSDDQILKVTLSGDQDKYFSIETERWSFNTIDDLVKVLEVIKKLQVD